MSDSELTYQEWALAKYKETQKFLNPCNEQDEIDPIRLNKVLTKFGPNFAWAVTVQEIETNRLNVMQTQHDEWIKSQWEEAQHAIMEERGGTSRLPSADAIKARITLRSKGEVEERQVAIHNQRSRVDLLKGFVKVMDRQGGILQTLSGNMRSELFFAGGVPIGRDLTDREKTSKAKAILRRALKGQGRTEEY